MHLKSGHTKRTVEVGYELIIPAHIRIAHNNFEYLYWYRRKKEALGKN